MAAESTAASGSRTGRSSLRVTSVRADSLSDKRLHVQARADGLRGLLQQRGLVALRHRAGLGDAAAPGGQRAVEALQGARVRRELRRGGHRLEQALQRERRTRAAIAPSAGVVVRLGGMRQRAHQPRDVVHQHPAAVGEHGSRRRRSFPRLLEGRVGMSVGRSRALSRAAATSALRAGCTIFVPWRCAPRTGAARPRARRERSIRPAIFSRQ